jgi:hypothetical protein
MPKKILINQNAYMTGFREAIEIVLEYINEGIDIKRLRERLEALRKVLNDS